MNIFAFTDILTITVIIYFLYLREKYTQKHFTLLPQISDIRLTHDLIFLLQNHIIEIHEIAHKICQLLRMQKTMMFTVLDLRNHPFLSSQ